MFRHGRAALRYDEQARRLILPLKHADRVELASVLAPMMVRAGVALLARADVLVPVPLHRRRLFQRKYNQAAVLAFAVGRLADRPVSPDALIRTRHTTPLVELAGSADTIPECAADSSNSFRSAVTKPAPSAPYRFFWTVSAAQEA